MSEANERAAEDAAGVSPGLSATRERAERIMGAHEDLLWLECPDCGDVQAFERPSCSDGPEDGCPEWCCTVCGAGVVEWMAAVRVVGRARRKLRGVA